MKQYTFQAIIFNDHGELINTQRYFDSMDELNAFMTDSSKMHELWCEAEKNGKEDGMLYEELYDSKEEADAANSDEEYERYRDNSISEPVSELEANPL